MKAFLMYRDRDFDAAQTLPRQAPELEQDLGLQTLFNVMARNDGFLLSVARTAVLASLRDPDEIRYRQRVLEDCLNNSALIRDIYRICVEMIESEKKNYWALSTRHPGSILRRAVELLQLFVPALRHLRDVAEEHDTEFKSAGFRTLFAMLRRELDEPYIAAVEAHIERLRFRRGPLISARLGAGIAGTDLVLRRPNPDNRDWLQRLTTRSPPSHTFHVHPRDEGGGRIVSELRDRGISIVANAAGQAVDHIISFFAMLRLELAFYIGCVNLHEELVVKGGAVCFPTPTPCGDRQHTARDLYDAGLALAADRKLIGNDLDADGTDLVVVTGPNQGGKTTWLRAIGVAQLMMQCGLFVPARSFCANICTGLFVHFRREEDVEMRAGKFEDELRRLSDVVDSLSPDAMLLFNESFQSTNEREGSEIGQQIVKALIDSRVKVFFVTHMYDLASTLYDWQAGHSLFLRAERKADGTRTFRIIPGPPLSTSFGKDVFDEIFFGLSRTSVRRDGVDKSDVEVSRTQEEMLERGASARQGSPGPS